ncbi:hypothetical protein HYT23_02695 [Candidatus Pacearchaeota archaeon]|nr:hypothetical protein [Candidatus Pacearchaeota archaeon]
MEGLMFNAILGSGSGIGNLLASWENAGVFTYLLPFLLIFAMIFAILSRMQIFKENRAVNGIIALVVGLMALQFEFVPRFFSEVFPRLGVGLSIILVILILTGMFIDPKKSGIMWTLFGVGSVIAIFVLLNTSSALDWTTSAFFVNNWQNVALAILVLVLVGTVLFSGRSKDPNRPASVYEALGFK